MRVEPERIQGVQLFVQRVHGDSRGHFVEQWRDEDARRAGLPAFVQDNAAMSHRNVLRGMHYQHPRGQGKLVQALMGTVFDAFVDLRRDSPTFGRWAGVSLSGENGAQVYIPPGLAHGYVVLTDVAIVTYKCTDYWDRSCEHSLLWSDPDIGIEWPVDAPVLAPRDAQAPLLRDIPPDHLPSAN